MTAEQLATADGVSLLSGDDGMAYAAMQALNRSLGYVDKGKVLTYQGPLP